MTAPASPSAAASPHVMTTYGRLPFALSHGQGCKVWDTEGREYLDALGGIGGIGAKKLERYGQALLGLIDGG